MNGQNYSKTVIKCTLHFKPVYISGQISKENTSYVSGPNSMIHSFESHMINSFESVYVQIKKKLKKRLTSKKTEGVQIRTSIHIFPRISIETIRK